jgi:hypothetical protein
VEHHPKAKGARTQRDRGADAAEPDDAETLHPKASYQLAFDRPLWRERALSLPLVIQDHAAAQ